MAGGLTGQHRHRLRRRGRVLRGLCPHACAGICVRGRCCHSSPMNAPTGGARVAIRLTADGDEGLALAVETSGNDACGGR